MLSYNSHRRPTASRFAIAAKNVDGFTGTFGLFKTRTCVEIKFQTPHAIDATLPP